MPLIEGVGDEVTIVFTLLLLFLILCIAWISTNIQELPFFSVIVVEFTRRQNRTTNQTNNAESSDSSVTSSSSEESTGDQVNQEELENVASVSSAENSEQNSATKSPIPVSSDGNVAETNEETQTLNNSNVKLDSLEGASSEDVSSGGITDQVSDDLPASETELRRRRVAFFSEKTEITESKQEVNGQKHEESLSKTASTAKTEPQNQDEDKSNGSAPSQNTANENDFESDSVQNQNDKVRIRLKYLNETQRNVEASLDDTIDQFRRTHFSEELAANKLVRFIFNGQDLRNGTNTLQAYNIVDNSVIHCLITQANRQTQQQMGESEDDGFDVGMLMLPCFGLLLLFMWYLRFEYKQFFSGTSTVCLIGMTLLYIAAMLATWENRRRGHNHVHVD